MRKIYRLKSWYSLKEAADRLTLTLEEPVSEEDVIQLVAEGHLGVSWMMDGSFFGRKVAVYCPFPRGAHLDVYSEPLPDEPGSSMAGGFDLPIDLCPSWAWWILTFVGKGGESGDLCGPLVRDENGTLWELYEPFGSDDFLHFPPKNSLVIRAIALEAFERSFCDDGVPDSDSDKPLSSREKNTLLKIINALCTANGLDTNAPYKAAEVIANHIEQAGQSVSVETIASKLKEVQKS
ncbi:hypothetical protein [Paraburkholderia pallida]|uniref:Uncharacterized protein n=1 Tax=Paraburkholderia pallida TaxID=2547399 RepID=A0A4P7CQ32_9BURK|nr:hypothetical protein [Paraburkholderia pallida]QBQ96301.1 hypothetical protein E1956_03355 [Paraburkholderia pallida]